LLKREHIRQVLVSILGLERNDLIFLAVLPDE